MQSEGSEAPKKFFKNKSSEKTSRKTSKAQNSSRNDDTSMNVVPKRPQKAKTYFMNKTSRALQIKNSNVTDRTSERSKQIPKSTVIISDKESSDENSDIYKTSPVKKFYGSKNTAKRNRHSIHSTSFFKSKVISELINSSLHGTPPRIHEETEEDLRDCSVYDQSSSDKFDALLKSDGTYEKLSKAEPVITEKLISEKSEIVPIPNKSIYSLPQKNNKTRTVNPRYRSVRSIKPRPKTNVLKEVLKPYNRPANIIPILDTVEDKFENPRFDEFSNSNLKRPALDENLKRSVKRSKTGDMLNGFRMADNPGSKLDEIVSDGTPQIASLLNIGNSCYLNSVIYTLRFTPLFLHHLHHVIEDLSQVHQKLNQTKAKSSSLGRNMVGLSGTNSRSWSNKDLPALGLLGNSNDSNNTSVLSAQKTPMQIATERLHELYQALHGNERKEHIQPFHCDSFLKAVQEVNRTFEGNHQQDAHELLMCIFEFIRETCKFLSTHYQAQSELLNGCSIVRETFLEEQPTSPPQSQQPPQPPAASTNTSKSIFTRKSLMKRSSKNSKNANNHTPLASSTVIGEGLLTSPISLSTNKDDKTSNIKSSMNGKILNIEDEGLRNLKITDYDFIARNFEGTTVSQTTCLSCEQVTECRETMFDIPVPIFDENNAELNQSYSRVYENACVTSEYLRDTNKYFCSSCLRYCEARRCISYERLPRLLILQIKRFSGGMEKISDFMPTPLELACFCNDCIDLPEERRLHYYRLYGVIMHLGDTMEVGHYIAYARALDLRQDYQECSDRTRRNHLNSHHQTGVSNINTENKTNSTASNLRNFFNRSKISSNASEKMQSMNNGSNSNTGSTLSSTCTGLSCCSSKFSRNNYSTGLGGPPQEDYINGGLTGNGTAYNSGGLSINVLDNQNHHNQPDMNSYEHQSRVWYKMDDATIKQISTEDFTKLVSCESPEATTSSTPYLLFYAKCDMKGC